MRRIILAVLALCVAGCPGPYAVAWRTLDGVQKARDLTASQLAEVARQKNLDCVKAHGAKTEGYATCIKAHRDALKQWQTIARPTINSAVAITAAGLQIAEKAKAKNWKWIDLAKPAICALARAVESFGHWFGDKGAAVLNVTRLAKGVSCAK